MYSSRSLRPKLATPPQRGKERKEKNLKL